jgi:hypothetical protein
MIAFIILIISIVHFLISGATIFVAMIGLISLVMSVCINLSIISWLLHVSLHLHWLLLVISRMLVLLLIVTILVVLLAIIILIMLHRLHRLHILVIVVLLVVILLHHLLLFLLLLETPPIKPLIDNILFSGFFDLNVLFFFRRIFFLILNLLRFFFLFLCYLGFNCFLVHQ